MHLSNLDQCSNQDTSMVGTYLIELQGRSNKMLQEMFNQYLSDNNEDIPYIFSIDIYFLILHSQRNYTQERFSYLNLISIRITLGQQFLLALYLWQALPAFSMGLSILPPPATMPTMARLAEGITFLVPEGIFTLERKVL